MQIQGIKRLLYKNETLAYRTTEMIILLQILCK